MAKQFIMMAFFNWLPGSGARCVAATAIKLLRQSLWLMLFLLGWASTAQADIPASERQVLLDLYASTNGAGWTNSTNWNGAVGTECTWYGIMCFGYPSHIVSVNLPSNNLVGSLPSLSGLTALRYFIVHSNQLTGSIPSLSGLTDLQWFSIYNNQLTGSIPSLSGLTALNWFEAGNNKLTGPVPAAPGSLEAGRNDLCGNSLVSSGDQSIDAAWATAQGSDWLACQTVTTTPVCTLTATPSSISAGGSSTLTVNCSPAAASYTWTGGTCMGSAANTCIVTPGSTTTYSVTGSNAAGSGNAVSSTVTVTATPPATPVCTLTVTPSSIYAGGSSTLAANCSPAATSYAWSNSGCASSSAFCTVAPTVTTTYTVAGANASGTGGNASATVTVTPASLLLTVNKLGSGTITSTPAGIDCGSTCSASFTSGTTVTLTATPADNNTYFYGWSGACTGAGTGSCVVTMDAAKGVTAIFKPVPFAATTIKDITPTSATITTTVSFNAADIGKTGAVYVTSWAPASGLSALGILPAPMNQAMSVTVTNDNPYSGGQISTRQETLAAVLATADPNAFVLIQLTSTGWQLVENGQLIPYASGILGDTLSSLSILNNADPSNLLGAQFCVGYGTSAAEMIASGRMIPVADIPGATATTNGSCNIAANPYKGLWYNPAESGWGMSVTQHDNINFVALYTYDQSSQPIWYVMSNCPIITASSCTGDIYQVTGGTPPGVAWNGTGKAVSVAGSGTLTFSDTNHGQFDFTLNGITGSKTIERQTFSSGTAAQSLDYTDLWWNASESGWGVALTQDVGMIFAAWYTYDAAGQPVWYVASSCPLSGSGCTGDVYKVTGGSVPTSPWAPNLAVTPVGSVSFTFSDASTGIMSYTIDGVAGSKAITRQAF